MLQINNVGSRGTEAWIDVTRSIGSVLSEGFRRKLQFSSLGSSWLTSAAGAETTGSVAQFRLPRGTTSGNRGIVNSRALSRSPASRNERRAFPSGHAPFPRGRILRPATKGAIGHSRVGHCCGKVRAGAVDPFWGERSGKVLRLRRETSGRISPGCRG